MTGENGLLGKLCAHLGKGRLDTDGVLRMAEIDRDCPDSCRPTPGRLYRAVTVSEEDHDDLIAGRDVIIGARSHDCWSASDVRIRHVLRHRSRQDENRPVCLILGRDFTAEELAVDVEALARHLGMDRCGIGLGVTWGLYASTEAEIMVRNPEGESRISPEDVAFCWRGEEVADLWAPVAGETFVTYDPDDRIVDRYLGRDDCGNFVVSSGDDFFRIVPENGYWICSGENPADPGEIATVFGENCCDGPSPVL